MEQASPIDVTVRTRPRRDEVRARVLAAARVVFADRGFAGASTDQVAAAAGFTKGAVYSNFGSKDELFLALMDAEGAARVAAVEQALDGTTDLPGALAVVGAELSRRNTSWQLLYLEFWQRAVRDPDVRTAFVASRRELRTRVTEVVERFLADHPVRTGWDAGSLTLVLLALTSGLALEALPDPDAVPDDVLPRVLADLLDEIP
ncbi:TetR/AcrR family transcriptional regulator [Modestobacter sp. Leaf380]|uniref:TetR/AcrR family transcriptional regulator n=1 Tax=Modestobacter sp. Leaf380 TaxID=1736356 RepID=UPI001910524A|nr:TetR/AcrR family transcriptional regulator [Modestobacter sp. Leaf380]